MRANKGFGGSRRHGAHGRTAATPRRVRARASPAGFREMPGLPSAAVAPRRSRCRCPVFCGLGPTLESEEKCRRKERGPPHLSVSPSTHTWGAPATSSKAEISDVRRNSGRSSRARPALGSRRPSPDTTSSRELSTRLASSGTSTSKGSTAGGERRPALAAAPPRGIRGRLCVQRGRPAVPASFNPEPGTNGVRR